MNEKPLKIESASPFSKIVKESLIRELFHRQVITQHQFERLMQLQRTC